MNCISKYKAAIDTPASKEYLNGIQSQMPNCTEVQLMKYLFAEYTQNGEENWLVDTLSTSLTSALNKADSDDDWLRVTLWNSLMTALIKVNARNAAA